MRSKNIPDTPDTPLGVLGVLGQSVQSRGDFANPKGAVSIRGVRHRKFVTFAILT